MADTGKCICAVVILLLVILSIPFIMEAVHAIKVSDGNPYGLWGDPNFDETAKQIFHIFKWGDANPSENFNEFKKDGVLHLNFTDEVGDDMRSIRIVMYEVKVEAGTEIRAFAVPHRFGTDGQNPDILVFENLLKDDALKAGEDGLYDRIQANLNRQFGDDKSTLAELGMDQVAFRKYIHDLEPLDQEAIEKPGKVEYASETKMEYLNYNIPGTHEAGTITTVHSETQEPDNGLKHFTEMTATDGHNIKIVSFDVAGNVHLYIIERIGDGEPTTITDLTPQEGAESLKCRYELPPDFSSVQTSFDEAVKEMENYQATEENVTEADELLMDQLSNYQDGTSWTEISISRWAYRRRLTEHVLEQILKL